MREQQRQGVGLRAIERADCAFERGSQLCWGCRERMRLARGVARARGTIKGFSPKVKAALKPVCVNDEHAKN
jgi:hypothetical protein